MNAFVAVHHLRDAQVLARDLVLTAAHCVTLPIGYRIRTFQNGATIPVRSVALHPRFNMATSIIQEKRKGERSSASTCGTFPAS